MCPANAKTSFVILCSAADLLKQQNMEKKGPITETTPLTENDCFYLVDRNKDFFTYPLHKHEEMELNFVEHCEGARRTVGDNIEVLGQYDLVLLGSGL